MKFIVTFSILYFNAEISQGQKKVSFQLEGNSTFPRPEKIEDQSEIRLVPSVSFTWESLGEVQSNGSLSFSVESPVDFSFMAIGWQIEGDLAAAESFGIRYRTKGVSGEWSNWVDTYGKVDAGETPSGFYWSDILFVHDSVLHRSCEIEFFPNRHNVTFFRVDFVNASDSSFPVSPVKEKSSQIDGQEKKQSISACKIPVVITRQEWCGGNGACVEPSYAHQVIQPTHVVIHHGGSPDSYTDGAAIVRSYWNYHVYSNGWDDIGYNFLIDKDGVIYQGRANPDFEAFDVKGAHAGSVNSSAIGVCFLGNSDEINATQVQLDRLYDLLAWWFNDRGFDPSTKEIIINQAGSAYLYLPRIIGHRDVKPNTICPGENVYRLLPNMITSVKQQIIECSNVSPHVDLSIAEIRLSSDRINAGEQVVVEIVKKIANVSEATSVPFNLGFWLSNDTIFNPAYDLLIKESVDSIEVDKDCTVSDSFVLSIDSGTVTGNYSLFVVSDYGNRVYETNESNNEISVPLAIKELHFDVVSSASPLIGGSVEGGGNFRYGERCNLKATPFFGYTFVGWTKESQVVSTNADYSFVVTEDRMLEANFACNPEPLPFSLVGDTSVCAGTNNITYSLPQVPNALSYSWSLPGGVIGNSNTNIISAQFTDSATSGKISVRIQTACFGELEKSKEVKVVEKPDPAVIVLRQGILLADKPDSYKWYCNGEVVDSLSSQYYVPIFKGSYYAVAVSEGCTSDRSNEIYFDAQSGNNHDSAFFILFPNPASGHISFFFAENLTKHSIIEIFDINGKKVFSQDLQVGTRYLFVETDAFQRGLYVVNVLFGKKKYSARFIKN